MKMAVCVLLLSCLLLTASVSAADQNVNTGVFGNGNDVNVAATYFEGATSVSQQNMQIVNFNSATTHHLLDGGMPGDVVSFSMAHPLVLPINLDNQTATGRYIVKADGNLTFVRNADSRFYQYRKGDSRNFRLLMPGERWNIWWYSSVPVYVYAIHGYDKDKVDTLGGAPSVDGFGGYDHGNIAVVKGSDSMQLSRTGESWFIVPDDGFQEMAFVIDPRVTDYSNGISAMNSGTKDTFEVTFEISHW